MWSRKHKGSCWKGDWEGANLRRADLNGADLREANLIGANLREANLSGADLNAVFYKTKITKKQKKIIEESDLFEIVKDSSL